MTNYLKSLYFNLLSCAACTIIYVHIQWQNNFTIQSVKLWLVHTWVGVQYTQMPYWEYLYYQVHVYDAAWLVFYTFAKFPFIFHLVHTTAWLHFEKPHLLSFCEVGMERLFAGCTNITGDPSGRIIEFDTSASFKYKPKQIASYFVESPVTAATYASATDIAFATRRMPLRNVAPVNYSSGWPFLGK